MMDFNSAEEWVKYIYEEAFFYLKSGKIEVAIERLRKLIDLIPIEFIEHENIKKLEELCMSLKELSDELDEDSTHGYTVNPSSQLLLSISQYFNKLNFLI